MIDGDLYRMGVMHVVGIALLARSTDSWWGMCA